MPNTYPPESKRDLVMVARRGDLSVPEVAADFGVSEESVRRWKRLADIDAGVLDGETSSELAEIVQLRGDKRRLEVENEILRRAAAYFAASTLPSRLRRVRQQHEQSWPPSTEPAADARAEEPRPVPA